LFEIHIEWYLLWSSLIAAQLKDEADPTLPAERNQLCDRGIHHIAFSVGDVEAACQRLRGHGCQVLSQPVTSPDGIGLSACVIGQV